MKKSERQIFYRLKYGDFIVLLVSIFLIIILVGKNQIFSREGKSALVIVDSVKVLEIDLLSGKVHPFFDDEQSDLYKISIDESDCSKIISLTNSGVELKIKWEPAKIGFLESDCRDKICVNTGYISGSGQVAACIPSGVLIKIIGEQGEDDPDIIID